MAATGGTLVVAAIDFGTTYSGWAFSFKNEFEMEPTRIGSKTWTGGKLSSPKAPTCILIRPDGKTLEAFGFEAESRYSELSESEAYKFWYYFRRFKMSLWNKPIHKDMMLTDETGRELSALHVFALSIRFMKDDLSKVIEHRVAGYKEDDITWVLTVPAIWDDSAKHFMRLAAEQAGISADKLMLALEPEAASLYCRHLPVQIDGESSLSTFHAGQKYLVLDAGGGTIDITVHEVCDVDSIKEIHHANGGDWGGTMIDREFLNFLCTITDTAVIGQFRENHMEDYIDLLQDIENKKRALDTKTRRVTIKIPLVLSDLTKDMTGQSINENIQKYGYGTQVSLVGDKLRLEADFVRSFFRSSVSKITEHLSKLLRMPECVGVEAILMVGGYSESILLQETIRQWFSDLKIFVPPEAGLAVLKGAVIYGHCPKAICERISKYTYGIKTSEIFDKSKHPMSMLSVTDTGESICKNTFSIIVRAGDKLVLGVEQVERTYRVMSYDQKIMFLPVFITTAEDPKYTTDVGCTQIGTVMIPLAGLGKNRSVLVRMFLGGTEIIVECVEEATGRITRLYTDFLM